MYSRKTKKSALESMMFVMGEAIEVKDAGRRLESCLMSLRTSMRWRAEEYASDSLMIPMAS